MKSFRRSSAVLVSAVLIAAGCDTGPGEGRAAVITSVSSPQHMTKCPEKKCVQYTVQGFRCGKRMRASTVIVSGASAPPSFLDTTPETVASTVACFHPELVVLDTTYGTSTQYLKALAKAGVTATVVASPRKVPAESFTYGPSFWSRAPVAERAAAVQPITPAQTIIRWPLNIATIDKAEQLAAGLSKEELQTRLHAVPNHVKVEPEPGVDLLVFVPPDRLR